MTHQTTTDTAYDSAIEAAISATAAIMPFWPNPLNSAFDKTLALEVIDKAGTGNYATAADLTSEKIIIETIQSKPELKDHSIVAEESGEIAADRNWRWIIDPIDGTPNFRNGNPDFGMCIALFNGQTPALGLIAMPALRLMAVAKHGGDAMLLDYDGKQLAYLRDLISRNNDPLDKALVGYDLGYQSRAAGMQQVHDQVITKVGYAVCLASFSTGVFRLLQGMMGVYFGLEGGPTIMDIAPAAALIPAAGGVISDIHGNPIDWRAKERSFVGAANPKLHADFLALFK